MNWRGVYRSRDGLFVVEAEKWWSLRDRRASRRLARSLDDPVAARRMRERVAAERSKAMYASRVN